MVKVRAGNGHRLGSDRQIIPPRVCQGEAERNQDAVAAVGVAQYTGVTCINQHIGQRIAIHFIGDYTGNGQERISHDVTNTIETIGTFRTITVITRIFIGDTPAIQTGGSGRAIGIEAKIVKGKAGTIETNGSGRAVGIDRASQDTFTGNTGKPKGTIDIYTIFIKENIIFRTTL